MMTIFQVLISACSMMGCQPIGTAGPEFIELNACISMVNQVEKTLKKTQLPRAPGVFGYKIECVSFERKRPAKKPGVSVKISRSILAPR